MTVLGIETSTAACSVGLANEGGRLDLRSIVESHIHSEKLQTLILELLQASDMRLKDIDVVAVSIGPGSFTGLRIGLSSAKGLCFALSKPLIVVPTFDAIAACAFKQHRTSRVTVCVDAKQGEFYVGVFEPSRTAVPVGIKTLQDLRRVFDGSTLVVTDKPDLVRTVVGDGIQVVDLLPLSRGDEIAHQGFEKLRTSDVANVATVEPMYLKDFVVRTHMQQE